MLHPDCWFSQRSCMFSCPTPLWPDSICKPAVLIINWSKGIPRHRKSLLILWLMHHANTDKWLRLPHSESAFWNSLSVWHSGSRWCMKGKSSGSPVSERNIFSPPSQPSVFKGYWQAWANGRIIGQKWKWTKMCPWDVLFYSKMHQLATRQHGEI